MFEDLRGFISFLEENNMLKRVTCEVDPDLEVAGILDRLVKTGGPAVLFENVKGSDIPIVANLFGTEQRVMMGLGTFTPPALDSLGDFIASMQRPKPFDFSEIIKNLEYYTKVFGVSRGAKIVSHGHCQDCVQKDVDLFKLPLLKCYQFDAGKLITFPLVVTQSPDGSSTNVGVYEVQVIEKNKVIVRWLSTRGGAEHFRQYIALGKPMPVSIAIGCDPATMISAVTPLPDNISEFDFAGILRKKRLEIVKCKTNSLSVPARSEIVIEGEIMFPGEYALQGPFGDHTGYYCDQVQYPVLTVNCITHRKNPIYHATITGRPPREDAVIGKVLNRLCLPTLRQFFPEIVDFNLPMEAASYRMAIISIKKRYPGHARRVMMGIWGMLKQFMYVKYIIITDDDINVNSWDDVIWAIATRADPQRDVVILNNTHIDYLDFASVGPEIGGKMGIDATIKQPPEAYRVWNVKADIDIMTRELVERRWAEYDIFR